jgi:hypothetical protein
MLNLCVNFYIISILLFISSLLLPLSSLSDLSFQPKKN